MKFGVGRTIYIMNGLHEYIARSCIDIACPTDCSASGETRAHDRTDEGPRCPAHTALARNRSLLWGE
jgi:hypothetical protein